MKSVESLLYHYLEHYGFISWNGGIKTVNAQQIYFSEYMDNFFTSYLKAEGINIVAYSWDNVETYGNCDDEASRITFSWYDGEKIEMCAFIEDSWRM